MRDEDQYSVKGRRRKDTPHGSLPSTVRRCDYWKVLKHDSSGPLMSDEPGNLTKTTWMVAAPIGERGFAISTLTKHTVREHDDRTISVVPGDGSSNSILITGSHGQQFHGFIDHGMWRAV